MFKKSTLLVGASLFGVMCSSQALAGPFNVLDLGTLGGATSNAFGLNANATKAVGSSDNGAEIQAFVYSCGPNYAAGTMLGLNTLTGGNVSEARAINASGVVAGFSRNGASASSERAVIWNGTTPTLLANVSGGTTARAYGISDSGSTVGFVSVGGVRKAFFHNGTSMSVLNLDGNVFDLTQNAEALSISANGRYISGKAFSATNLGEVHGFLYDTTTNTSIDLVSSANTVAWGVSNNYVSGQESGLNLGFQYNIGTAASYGAPTPTGGTGISYDVNNVGEFVGTELDVNTGDPLTAWLSDGTNTFDLNTRFSDPNVILRTATGVAEFHQMTTGQADFSGAQHAYLLVPEPSSAVFLLLGLPALAAMRRKSKKA